MHFQRLAAILPRTAWPADMESDVQRSPTSVEPYSIRLGARSGAPSHSREVTMPVAPLPVAP